MKALDALKAAAIVLILLSLCIAVIWIFTQLIQPKEPQPDRTPRPAESMWENSTTTR